MAVYDVATRLVVQGVDTASVQKAVSTINTQLDRGTANAKSFSDALALRGINLAGYTALGAVVVRISSSIAKATNDAIKFEYELAKIAQTVNKSNEEIRGHADSIRKISVAYGLSAPKIAETVRVLAQAGYSFKEAKASADSLAQTTLLSSFESISDTTDGLIAINKQFVNTMGQSARVLSILNTVSKKYAVESSDLVEATRKAGGVFASTGGTLEELVTVFTTVRDTTRETAETVATGLRTIFGRLQRPKTIEYMRELGIELTDLKGNFIGNYEAIKAIQEGISKNKIAPNSLQFAAIVEQLGGIRQQSRVIPLLTQAAKMQQIYSDAQSSASDTAKDLAKAQDTLSFKIAQTQQNFSKFIGDIAATESFKKMVDVILSLTNATIGFASSIKELIPLIAGLATLKLGSSLFKALSTNPSAAFGNIGQKRKFASGGFVPGSGSGDTVPAMLTPGEFVIRKSAAQAMGAETLQGINKYGLGGPVTASGKKLNNLYKSFNLPEKQKYTANVNAVAIKSNEGSSKFDLIAKKVIAGMQRSKRSAMWQKFEDGVSAAYRLSLSEGNAFLDYPTKPGDSKFLKAGATYGGDDGKGNTNETMLGKLIGSGKYDKGEREVTVFYPENPSQLAAIVKKRSTAKANIKNVGAKKLASGGSVGTDTVPALLTPGEFVVNKKSAQAFGYGNLHKVNKYAAGGTVSKIQSFARGGGIQKFEDGGEVDASGLTKELKDLIEAFKKKAPFLYKRGKSRLDLGGVSEKDLAALEAEAEQIRQALKKQSGKMHPDRFQGESGAEERFKSVRSKFDEFSAGTEQIKKQRTTASQQTASSANPAEQSKKAQEAHDKAQAQKTQQEREDDAKAAQATARANAEEARRTREKYKAQEKAFNDSNAGLGGANGDSASSPFDLGGASAKQKAYNQSQENAGLGSAEGNTRSPNHAPFNDFDAAGERQKAYNTSQEDAQNAGLGPAAGNTSSFRPTNVATPGMAAKQAAYNKSQEGAGLGPAIGNTKSNPVNISDVGDKLTADSKAKSESAAKAQQLAGTFATLGFVISGVADQYTDQETVMGRMTSSVLNLVSGLSILQGVLGQFGKSLDPKSVLDFGKNLLNFGKGGKGAIAGKIANASSGFLGKAGGAISGLGGKLSGVGAKFAGSSGAMGMVGKASASAGASLSARGATVAGSSGSVGAAGASAAAFAAAGAAAYGFGKALDSIRGLEEQRAKAIANGNIAEAGKAAVSLQAQDDITKLATGAAIVATAFGGPLIGAAVGVAVKLAGLIPGVEAGVGKMRDFGASLGILESTTLIAARAQSEAATVAADANRNKQANIVGKKLEKVKDTKGANELVNSSEFKNASQALANKKAAVDKQVGEAKNALSQQANTSGLGESIDALTSLGGLVGENLDETATRLDKEISDAQAGLKAQAEADFQQYSKVFDVKIQDFAGSGEEDWGKFMGSLTKSEQDLITLSGSANLLQESLKQAADVAKAEAAERLLNWQIMQKTSGALQQLAAISKKGAEASRLGDVTSDLSSGNFRSSAISSAASSDSIKTQSAAAKALGINNYENIVGETTKNKDVLKQAENKFAQGTLKGGSGELDRIKREIIQDLNPDANVKDLKGDDLNKAVEAVFAGGDAMKEALLKAANDTESGVNKYIDSVSRVTSAQTEYSQSLLDFSQTNTNRDKEKQGFRVGGSTIAEIRGRQTPIGSNIEGRRGLVANSARLSTIGTSVVANQAAQSASGKEDPSKTAATVSQGIELQRTFSGLQIATEAQKAAVIQDTQARQQLIDALKEEIELEKGRAQTLDEFNVALSGAAGAEAKRDAQKKLASVKRVEQAYATGGVDAANKEIGRSVDKGVSRDFLLSAMQTQTSEALGYQASESGSTEARKRYGAGADQSGFISDSTSVAFGRDAEGKRTRQTVRGAEVSAQAGSQMDEQRANDAALLKLQSDNIEMLSNSAKIFGDSIGQMTAGLGSFNTELKTIVASLKDSSISMKLDTTKVVVDINSSQGLEAMSAETKRMVKQMVADQLLAQQQGQI